MRHNVLSSIGNLHLLRTTEKSLKVFKESEIRSLSQILVMPYHTKVVVLGPITIYSLMIPIIVLLKFSPLLMTRFRIVKFKKMLKSIRINKSNQPSYKHELSGFFPSRIEKHVKIL